MRTRGLTYDDEFESSLGPMVDMVFLLLTFFLFTFQVKLQELNYPIETTVAKSQTTSKTRPIEIDLSSTPDGSLASAVVDGRPAHTADEIGQILRQLLGARRETERQARVRPVPGLRYEAVVQTVVVARNSGWSVYLTSEDYPKEKTP